MDEGIEMGFTAVLDLEGDPDGRRKRTGEVSAVVDRQERECFLEELERRMVQKGRVGPERAGTCVREALGHVSM